jgi:DNA-binding GntR family transcriptional regulator
MGGLVAGGDLGLYIERPEQLLRERVADTLREAILRGVLAPGRRLTERELGELTGVSRTSLREALRQLQAEGLLEPSEGRGLRVAVLTGPVVAELYDVRAVLESAAVEMFVRNASDEQLDALIQAVGSPPPPGTGLEEGMEHLRRVYAILLEGTGNAILQQMFGSIEARIHSLRRVSLRAPGRAVQSHREFAEVISWISKRDATRAAEAAKVHVTAAKAAALTAVKEMRAPNG